jgi:hypothetical protein
MTIVSRFVLPYGYGFASTLIKVGLVDSEWFSLFEKLILQRKFSNYGLYCMALFDFFLSLVSPYGDRDPLPLALLCVTNLVTVELTSYDGWFRFLRTIARYPALHLKPNRRSSVATLLGYGKAGSPGPTRESLCHFINIVFTDVDNRFFHLRRFFDIDVAIKILVLFSKGALVACHVPVSGMLCLAENSDTVGYSFCAVSYGDDVLKNLYCSLSNVVVPRVHVVESLCHYRPIKNLHNFLYDLVIFDFIRCSLDSSRSSWWRAMSNDDFGSKVGYLFCCLLEDLETRSYWPYVLPRRRDLRHMPSLSY